MKKSSLLSVILGALTLVGAELPDLSKADMWQQSKWSKSVYSRSENGVLCLERTLPGSGAWCTKEIAVTAGEKFAGVVDINYISQDGKGRARLGVNLLNAEGKRVLFLNPVVLTAPNGGFETRKFSFKVPQGTVSASIYLCLDGIGKAEFRNVILTK